MRRLRRSARRAWAEWRLRGRRAQIAEALAADLGRAVRLRPAGASGRDSIYEVDAAGGALGVLRLANPWRRRPQLAPEMPFRWIEDDAARIEREWSAYEAGAPRGLTPRPLWRCPDALLCARLPGERLSDRMFAQPLSFWTLASRASAGLVRLHESGVTQMDACLANTLARDEIGDAVAFVDFEYGPAPDLERPAQRAYDHLRLVESSLKFVPAQIADGFDEWIAVLDRYLDRETRGCDVSRLRPALERLWAHDKLRAALARVFVRLEP